MSNDRFWKPLAFTLSGLLLGVVVAAAQPSHADEATAACKRWEVSIWSPAEDGCKFKGFAPYTHRDEWCKAPEGVEIGNGLGEAFKIYVKRCAER